MAEKVILEGRSAEDFIDLFRREGALTPEIKEYFTSYCDCDIAEWLIAQLTAHNQEVVDRVNELLAAYDPYPVHRETKFPVHGHLVKTFCDGKDLKGYYAINSQGLQTYDKKVIVANSPLCDTFIVYDTFKKPNENYTDSLEGHSSEKGLIAFADPTYSASTIPLTIKLLKITTKGLTTLRTLNYFGQANALPFESHGFPYVDAVSWANNRRVEMATTVFFPLKAGSTSLADWPHELTVGMSFGADASNPVQASWYGTRCYFSFHRYTAQDVANTNAIPGYNTQSRFDPRANQIYAETWVASDSGLDYPTSYTNIKICKIANNDEASDNTLIDELNDAISRQVVTDEYATVSDENGMIPSFFTKVRRVGGELQGYELTVKIRINIDAKTVALYVNNVKMDELAFTIDFHEYAQSWYPQLCVMSRNMDKTELEPTGFFVTEFYVKDYTYELDAAPITP